MEHCLRTFRILLLFTVGLGIFPGFVAADAKTSLWYQQDQSGNWQVNLYFFWSSGCPHCQEAMPVIAKWEEKRPWLAVESLEVTGSAEHLADAVGHGERSEGR